MLTFRFTGGMGQMVESEILASGMVGRQVRFLFSEEWDGLKKTAVYRAGPVSCTSEDIGQTDVIPERVLRKALRRLYVGVRGESEDGQVVIPTVLVPGPFIHIGTTEGPDYDPQDPDWKDVLRCTPQTLTEEQKAQARANIGITGGGLGGYAGALLLNLLRKAVFTGDVSETILALEAAMEEPQIPQEPGEPEKVYYSVSCGLEHVAAQPASMVVEKGEGCTVTLTAEEGYELEAVTVTMGGVNITSSAYANGRVSIGSVTGHVVITARAVLREEASGELLFLPAFLSANQFHRYEYPSTRMTVATTQPTADTPIPQNGNQGLGDLYLLPVPAGTNLLKVTSPGLVGGPQFLNLSGGVYTTVVDTGYLTEGGFEYAFQADAYGYVGINFKKADGSAFFTREYDTSAVSIEFLTVESGEPEEEAQASVTLVLTKTSATNNQRTVSVGKRYVNQLVPADGCTLETVTVTMGGADITAEVCKNGSITIETVTGDIVVTAVAREEAGGLVFIPATLSAGYLNRYEYPSNRVSLVTREAVADTPFPQNGNQGLGDLYLLPVPAEATELVVVSPGLIGGPQFFTLEDGVYTCQLDGGWKELDGFVFAFEAGVYDYMGINFKNSGGTAFFTEDYDTSGISVTFR